MLTLKDLALSNAAARVLERYHLDYCCGGKQTLAAACASAGHDLQAVVAALDEALSAPQNTDADVEQRSQGALIAFIVDTHHAFTRSELQRIDGLLQKVIARHGDAHPELKSIGACFGALQADLGAHLLKEEQVLFPYVRDLERHRHGEIATPPAACFGTIENPLRQMTAEHQTVGDLLKKIRHLTSDFTVPADGCPTYRSTYQAMEGLEVDLMRHIHLENNVLFPRARQMAAGTLSLPRGSPDIAA